MAVKEAWMANFVCELRGRDGEWVGWVEVEAEELPDVLLVGVRQMVEQVYLLDQHEILARKYYQATWVGCREADVATGPAAAGLEEVGEADHPAPLSPPSPDASESPDR